ncbi:MAG: preprotein translocase subunit SecG [Candidatus Muproteobacteria bacterium RBG_16_65_34]|uniref:Protein-export membrane protein SecG n=1 Tax=Candidatus Muproteobacteria bacterium RBG_16_65_34 TaxID=1817760 RepID=A0A1F6TKY3_9PROT|nr:MAG: preprotein translocase subunit SecG [Candidatus Muproteobacteria bacterium RBG_16_65_34]
MRDIILVIDVVAAMGLVGLVLLQQGKGADMGAAFGSGASQTLFGSRGSANFLTRTTAILAVIFFSANLALAWFATQQTVSSSVTQSVTVEQPAAPQAPAAGAAPEAPKAPEVPK